MPPTAPTPYSTAAPTSASSPYPTASPYAVGAPPEPRNDLRASDTDGAPGAPGASGTSAAGRRRQPARRGQLFLISWVLVFLVIPAWFTVGLLIGSVASAVAWVGLVLWLVTAGVMRGVTGTYRSVAGRILGEQIRTTYRRPPARGIFVRLHTTLTDPARWRDVAYLFFAISLGFAISLSALIAFFIFPIGYWLSPLLLRIWAATTRAIIGPSGEQELQQRIGQLEESRSESVDHSAAELRRIERDLHDGAQAQLVALGMNLGLAEELVLRDPQQAATLIAEARTSSRSALADLRSLVRGIHPPVLADRGLVGGIEALALAHARDVETDVALTGRPPEPVESAVYFAVAEALTNSAKYAGARNTWVWLRHDGVALTALVGDDGVGGARFTADGGLAGIERRMAAFDGSVSVASPSGGPTIVTITVPCVLEPAPAG